MTSTQTVRVDGQAVKLTNLGKVLYPATGTTKADVLAYLAAVGHVLIPHAANRPVTRKRWPDGVAGQVFFHKDLGAGTPPWVRRREIQHLGHTNTYPMVNDLATLTWLGQIASLEIHVPQWQFGRTGVRLAPDRLILDLDPGPGAGLAECAQVARWAREILTGMGLEPWPVTTGSKGIHLYAALDGSQDAGAISAVAHELARFLESAHPDLVVSDMKKALRTAKVLIDWSQNNPNKTTIAPYSLRGRDRPMVAAPRTWEELEDPDLRHLDKDEVVARVGTLGDPLAPVLKGHVAALEPTPQRLATFNRLAVYRAKRDPARTPEPVPTSPQTDAPGLGNAGTPGPSGAGAQDAGSAPNVSITGPDAAPSDVPVHDPGVGMPRDGRLFVIQEHHARRLHWDFRLERDGVLVSWALPKGEPTDRRENHLAIQTEDHPLEYGNFEGTIPAGEYGGGEVRIWDAGWYETEKWADDQEVIVTVHGEKRGTRRLALIHTRGPGPNGWLIHLMAPLGATKATNGSNSSGATDGSGAQAPRSTTSPDTADRPGRSMANPDTTTHPRRTADTFARTWSPMLATARTHVDDDDSWAFEMKWDGFRALTYIGMRGVTVTSRRGTDMTAAFPDLTQLEHIVPEDRRPVVLDGEIVAIDSSGRPNFRLLQQRANLAHPASAGPAEHAAGVDYMVFDLLELGGRSMTGCPYDERRAALRQLLDHSAPPIHVPTAFHGHLDIALSTSRRLGLEGIVAKRRNSTYVAGNRSTAWLKIKHIRSQEVVVVGWRPGHGARAHLLGSLLLAVPSRGQLRYAGRVGSGFTDRERHDIPGLLRARDRSMVSDVPRADTSDAHWVTPDRVAEVTYSEWTGTSAQDPGKLRQPVWRGWRADKSPSDIAVEQW